MDSYVGLVDFLGQVLGPDYGIVLYERTASGFAATAVSNGHICDCSLGSALPPALLQRLEHNAQPESDGRAAPVVPVAHVTRQQKILRASIHGLQDEQGELNGAICIYFDDGRYRNLSAQLLRLRHPDAFVEHYFEATRQREPSAAHAGGGLAREALSPEQVLQKHFPPSAMPSPGKLTTKERIALVDRLMDTGFFELKGAINALARHLACSPATVYRYVARCRTSA